MLMLIVLVLFSPAFIVGAITLLSKAARALPARRT